MAAKKAAKRGARKVATTGARKSPAKKTTRTTAKTGARKSPAKKSGTKAAKKDGRKFGRKASEKIGQVMHEFADGELKSGKGGAGGPVKSREQAIAIGISEARAEGDKVPKQRTARKSSGRKRAGKTVS